MALARIQTIGPQAATGEIKPVYDQLQQCMGRVPNIFQSLSLRPPLLSATANLVGAAMLAPGALPRDIKETIAVVVSRVNHCHY